MAEIKWTNVDGSNMNQATQLMGNRADVMYDRVKDLNSVFQTQLSNMQKGITEQFEYEKEQNTQQIINQMLGAESQADIDRMKALGLDKAEALTGKFGNKYDLSKINQTKASWISDTQARATAKDNLKDTTDKAKETRAKLNSLILAGETGEAIKFLEANQGVFSNNLYNSLSTQLNERYLKDREYASKLMVDTANANAQNANAAHTNAETESIRLKTSTDLSDKNRLLAQDKDKIAKDIEKEKQNQTAFIKQNANKLFAMVKARKDNLLATNPELAKSEKIKMLDEILQKASSVKSVDDIAALTNMVEVQEAINSDGNFSAEGFKQSIESAMAQSNLTLQGYQQDLDTLNAHPVVERTIVEGSSSSSNSQSSGSTVDSNGNPIPQNGTTDVSTESSTTSTVNGVSIKGSNKTNKKTTVKSDIPEQSNSYQTSTEESKDKHQEIKNTGNTGNKFGVYETKNGKTAQVFDPKNPTNISDPTGEQQTKKEVTTETITDEDAELNAELDKAEEKARQEEKENPNLYATPEEVEQMSTEVPDKTEASQTQENSQSTDNYSMPKDTYNPTSDVGKALVNSFQGDNKEQAEIANAMQSIEANSTQSTDPTHIYTESLKALKKLKDEGKISRRSMATAESKLLSERARVAEEYRNTPNLSNVDQINARANEIYSKKEQIDMPKQEFDREQQDDIMFSSKETSGRIFTEKGQLDLETAKREIGKLRTQAGDPTTPKNQAKKLQKQAEILEMFADYAKNYKGSSGEKASQELWEKFIKEKQEEVFPAIQEKAESELAKQFGVKDNIHSNVATKLMEITTKAVTDGNIYYDPETKEYKFKNTGVSIKTTGIFGTASGENTEKASTETLSPDKVYKMFNTQTDSTTKRKNQGFEWGKINNGILWGTVSSSTQGYVADIVNNKDKSPLAYQAFIEQGIPLIEEMAANKDNNKKWSEINKQFEQKIKDIYEMGTLIKGQTSQQALSSAKEIVDNSTNMQTEMGLMDTLLHSKSLGFKNVKEYVHSDHSGFNKTDSDANIRSTNSYLIKTDRAVEKELETLSHALDPKGNSSGERDKLLGQLYTEDPIELQEAVQALNKYDLETYQDFSIEKLDNFQKRLEQLAKLNDKILSPEQRKNIEKMRTDVSMRISKKVQAEKLKAQSK